MHPTAPWLMLVNVPETSTIAENSAKSARKRKPRLDKVLAECLDLAREAAEAETGPEAVGEYIETIAEDDRVASHYFETKLAGYRGWRWSVVITRAPRSKSITISEVVLLPGVEAITAPVWVPWAERLENGEVGVGEILPSEIDDDRLMPAYLLSDDEAVEDVAFELGVGRTRIMNREGRVETAQRWYEGNHGPFAAVAEAAPSKARCGTCGFFLALAGSLRQEFGACGNAYSSQDGQVVSADHGCGAHSEVGDFVNTSPQGIDISDVIYDDSAAEEL